jgi:hypothetical protein
MALQLGSAVPERPKPVIRVYPKPAVSIYPKSYFSHIYRGDAFRIVLSTAIRIHDVGAARRTAGLWRESEGAEADDLIAGEWMRAGVKDEAMLYVRGIEKAADRVPALLWMAGWLLDAAGAPSV